MIHFAFVSINHQIISKHGYLRLEKSPFSERKKSNQKVNKTVTTKENVVFQT